RARLGCPTPQGTSCSASRPPGTAANWNRARISRSSDQSSELFAQSFSGFPLDTKRIDRRKPSDLPEQIQSTSAADMAADDSEPSNVQIDDRPTTCYLADRPVVCSDYGPPRSGSHILDNWRP